MKKIFILITLLAATVAAHAQNLQGTMETWQTYNVGFPIPTTQLEKPSGWRGADSLICVFGPFVQPGGNFGKQVFKSSIAHGGSFAARLVSRDQDTLGVVPGLLTNAIIEVDLANQDFSFTGGVPVTGKIDSVKAWVRYLPKGTDTGVMTVLAVITGAGAGGNDSVVGMGAAIISEDTNYYQVVAAVEYPNGATPTALQVTFTGSLDLASGTDSTELFVDDVSAVGTVGIKMQLFEEDVVQVYPNPAKNSVYLANAAKEPISWELYNIAGAKVMSMALTKERTEADISSVAAGVYIYQLKNKAGEIIQTGKLNVSR